MVSRKKYEEARMIVDRYEAQLETINQKECYVLVREDDKFTMVTTDKGYADRLYANGSYIMRISTLCNPQE